MQSSLFEPGRPVLVVGHVQATVGVGTVLIWDFVVAYVRAGGVYMSAVPAREERWESLKPRFFGFFGTAVFGGPQRKIGRL